MNDANAVNNNRDCKIDCSYWTVSSNLIAHVIPPAAGPLGNAIMLLRQTRRLRVTLADDELTISEFIYLKH